MNRLVDLNLEVLTEATDYIALMEEPAQKVYDKQYILEFYKNIDSKMVTKIQETFAEVASKGAVPPQETTCAGCSQPITVAVTFDYANFFAPGS
jgi:predicted  nucleic acid-binding Zn-ribbon protein